MLPVTFSRIPWTRTTGSGGACFKRSTKVREMISPAVLVRGQWLKTPSPARYWGFLRAKPPSLT
jgi:hypothetical protein